MAAQVLSFFQRSPRFTPASTDWSQQELAEFYRVESALIRAGIRVGTDRGLSDENEPWFVFYRADDGEVVIHFARIDGEYMIAGPAYEEIARGFDFSTLVRNMVARHPLIRRPENNGNLSIHPAALLVAVVGTAFFKTGEARAAETGPTTPHSAPSRPVLLSSGSSAPFNSGVAPINVPSPSYDTVQIPANQAVLILAAALLASDYSVDASSLDPNTRAAMTAAAAALDFGGDLRVANATTNIVSPAATAHVLVENTPVQTITSVLSLVAILTSLPTTTAPVAPAEALHLTAPAKDHDFSAIASPLPANDGDWSINVHLSFDALPAVQAVQLVRGVLGEPGHQTVSVIELNQLPEVLANIIARSDNHYVVPPTSYAPSTPSTPEVTPSTPAKPEGGDHPVGGDGAVTPPVGGGQVADPAPSPATPSEPTGGGVQPTDPTPSQPVQPPPIPPSPPVTQPPPGYATQEMVKMFLDYFIDHTTKVEVIRTGTSVVAFDWRILHDPGAIHDPEAITFTFDDGTTVSLVGDHSAFIQHTGLLH